MASLSTPTGGFGHPSLIYALCLQAGIQTGASEEMVHPQLAISPDLVKTFKGPPPSSSGAGTSSDPPSTSRQRPQPTPTATQMESSQMFSQLMRRLDRMDACHNRMVARHDRQYDHMMQCYSTLAAEVPTRSGAPIQLPPAPRFPPYPPGDDEAEDADVAAKESEEEGTGSDDSAASRSGGDDDEEEEDDDDAE